MRRPQRPQWPQQSLWSRQHQIPWVSNRNDVTSLRIGPSRCHIVAVLSALSGPARWWLCVPRCWCAPWCMCPTGRRSAGRGWPPFGWAGLAAVRLGGAGRISARLKCLRTTTGPGGHSPGNSYACAGIAAFPAVSLVADPSTPPRRPSALVTSRQDLLITVRAVITTVRLCPGLVDGTVVRVRLSRWYFAFCKYIVTCDVRGWQLNSKVSVPFRHKNRTKRESGECSNSGLAAGLR